MSICIEYDCDGNFSEYNSPNLYNLQNKFFRKMTDSRNEFEICRTLYENPHDNIVNFYNINESQDKIPRYEIDMEYLEYNGLNTKKTDKSKILKDIKSALDHLHKLNIVFIDLKFDNIGFNRKQNVYKIFDFDMSGIFFREKPHLWHFSPSSGYVLREFYKRSDNCSTDLVSIDDFAFTEFEKTFFSDS